jgi:hypothetical protein
VSSADEYRSLVTGAEHFGDWADAIDAAVERQRPVVARVGDEVAKCFPSRACQTIYRVYSSGSGRTE